MLKYIIVVYVFALVGCAAALVPESKDPRTKVDQATILFNEQGRPLAAAKLLRQAIPLAQRQNDKETEANAEFYLAEIQKAPGKGGEMLKNPRQAAEHYKRAIALYDELKLYKRAAFVSWNSSAVFEMMGDKPGVCLALREADKLHRKPGAAEKDTLPDAGADGALLKSIRENLAHNECGKR